MAYNGRTIPDGNIPSLDWSRTSIVLVKGDLPNTCGHVLLCVGGHYFQFSGPSLFDYPLYLNSHEYFAYLRSNNKEELVRKFVSIPNPNAAEARLRDLMQRKWGTLIFAHNCAGFVKTIINAGGNFYTFGEYCPVFSFGVKVILEERLWRN